MKRILVLVAASALIMSCSHKIASTEKEIIGAGATFPLPVYTKMFDAYYKEFGVKVNYQGVGSGTGIKQLLAKVTEFGGTQKRSPAAIS